MTFHSNRLAYSSLLIRLRYLIDVYSISTSTSLLSHPLTSPLLLAPVALQCMAHPEEEAASAHAAPAFGTTMLLSTTSTAALWE